MLVAFCMACICATAQGVLAGAGLRYQAGTKLIPLTGDVFSAAVSPAGPAAIRRFSMGIQSGKFTWTGSPLHARMALVLPAASGNFSGCFTYTGVDGYAAMQASAGFAKTLAHWLDGGIRINYYREAFRGYGAASAWPVDIELVFRLSDRLSSDFACWNLLGTRRQRGEKTRLARVLRSGFGFRLSDQAGISISVLAEESSDMSFQSFVYYRFHPRMTSGLTYSTADQGIWLTGMFDMDGWRLSVGLGYMSPLGSAGNLGLQYAGKEKEGS